MSDKRDPAGGDAADSAGSAPAWPAYCAPPAMVDAMLLLQERWVLFIVQALLVEPLGFNEIGRRATGVSTATLSQRLELLERKGMLTRRVIASAPPRTEYRLTPTGEALRPVLEAIGAWATAPRPAAEGRRTPTS